MRFLNPDPMKFLSTYVCNLRNFHFLLKHSFPLKRKHKRSLENVTIKAIKGAIYSQASKTTFWSKSGLICTMVTGSPVVKLTPWKGAIWYDSWMTCKNGVCLWVCAEYYLDNIRFLIKNVSGGSGHVFQKGIFISPDSLLVYYLVSYYIGSRNIYVY